MITIAAALAVALGCTAPLVQAQQKPIKIGFSMALTGGLAGAGKGALIAMEIWRDDVNKKGGLLGRQVELVFYDDATQPANVPGLYTKLLEVDKVDLLVSAYGTNLIAPAMPIVMRKKMVFPALFGLAANEEFKYDRYFQIMPAGPNPLTDWSKGFFELAMAQNPKPKTVAIVAADAEFALNAAAGARKNAQAVGLKIVYDKTYPPPTTDFSPIVRAIQATNPDVVFVGSYPPDSVGMVKAANEVGLKAKLFGGGMVGLQFAGIQKNLGPLLNGIVNYDFWVPEPTLNFPGVKEFLAKYQDAAKGKGVDPYGHYLPPYAYAYLQVLGQSVEATKGLDQGKLAAHMQKSTFNTVIGKVKFGKNGEWATTRVLQVQFRDVQKDNMEQFAGPGKRIVLYPREWKSGDIAYPYKQ
ncbi:MAG: branched-chain amino acid ABC transporter substrate-binding protein [Betaproteobacteria bacterium RIFCSPLOWO2_02_FULL_67_26]|nr:MAG: branched-chain amino acid ABC transporter substrate-binding protein [Betaproteobacteria bacterium RIFCSPLOWO2_02_FULL_67_26]